MEEEGGGKSRSSTRSRDLEMGKSVHAHACETGLDSDLFVASALVNMYTKCGSMPDARRVFDTMSQKDVVSWTSLLLGYADQGQGGVALDLFSTMQAQGCAPNDRTFVAALKACSTLAGKEEGVLERGRLIHSQAQRYGCEQDVYVASALVDMYAKCGSMEEASRVFNKLPRRDAVLWTTFMRGYLEKGEEEMALKAFGHMQRECATDARSFVAALRACATLAAKEEGKQVNGKVLKTSSLEKGMELHSDAAKLGFDSDLFVSNTLIDMYAKCGSMEAARRVFDRAQRRDVVSWNAIVQGYSDNGEAETALELFDSMEQFRGCSPNSLSFVAALRACTTLASREEGKQVDGKLVKLRALDRGMLIHRKAMKYGCDSDIVVANTLVHVYANCGSMPEARKVFDTSVRHRTVVSWNALILGYAESGEGDLALDVFSAMQREGCAPTARTFMGVLKACTSLAAREEIQQVDGRSVKKQSLETAREIHSQVSKSGFEADIYLNNSLVDLYCKCGSMVDARKVFDKMPSHTVVSWTVLILGYANSGEAEMALDLLARMPLAGFEPNALTLMAALKACIVLAAKEEGEEVSGKTVKVNALQKGSTIHTLARQAKCDSDIFLANTLIDMYAKCGSMVDADKVFCSMEGRRNQQTWTSIILGYAENGQGELALELFHRMQQEQEEKREGFNLDSPLFVAALKACGSLVKLEAGRAVHDQICRLGLESDSQVATSLIDVYGKCGSMSTAQRVFDSLSLRDSISWTALIAGYSRQGHSIRVFECFHEMQAEGFKPDDISLVCILTACSHAGLVDKGKKYFETMQAKYGVEPDMEHYLCMVDLLGRANQLAAAVDLVTSMPCKPHPVAWMIILSACRKWRNVEVGKLAFSSLVKLDDEKDSSAAAYILMASIYEDAGMLEDKQRIDSMRECNQGSHGGSS